MLTLQLFSWSVGVLLCVGKGKGDSGRAGKQNVELDLDVVCTDEGRSLDKFWLCREKIAHGCRQGVPNGTVMTEGDGMMYYWSAVELQTEKGCILRGRPNKRERRHQLDPDDRHFASASQLLGTDEMTLCLIWKDCR